MSVGELPTSLLVGGKKRAIRSDYRVALDIFEAYNDVNLNERQKETVLLVCLYVEPEKIEPDYYREALEKASWFLDGGRAYKEATNNKKVVDWEQDESMLFSAINRVAGKEVRAMRYMHWWTFLGYFAEMGECLYSTVLNIRSKKVKGKKLDKTEQEWYKANKDVVDLRTRYTEEEKAEMERLKALFK